jgi:beta-glucosidase
MVLLKNEQNTLPMTGTPTVSVFGVTSYNFIAGGTGSGDVNKAYTIDMMTGLKGAGLTVNEKLANVYKTYKDYQASLTAAGPARRGWFWGTPKLDELAINRNIINAQAQESDIAIITIGRQAGEGSDRQEANDFKLSDVEQQLIDDVCATFHQANKRVVVVLNMGNVIETASWKSKPDAILLAWQPGQEGGYSVADVLTGKENPSGKLSMTWPINLSDLPSSANFPNARPAGAPVDGKTEFRDFTLHKEGLDVGYRYFTTQNKAVSYPFGFGLSYTTFAYSKAKVKSTKDGFEASITITNTGSTAGKEAVQLYVSAPDGGLIKPDRELKSFAKTRMLQPGESQTLTMRVTLYDLASYNETTQAWETAAGKYHVHFAANVDDVRYCTVFSLSKKQSVKAHDVMRPDMAL